jgi:dolichyl-phosphate beta-glucosyltransferase
MNTYNPEKKTDTCSFLPDDTVNLPGQCISFIIPTCCDSRIYSSIEKMMKIFKELNGEIIIVDDSAPETFEAICSQMKKEYGNKVKVIKGDKQGKGSAVKKGVLAASGEIVFYLDSDLPVHLENVTLFISKIVLENFDIVIAERQFNFYRLFNKPVRFFLSIVLFLMQRLFVFNSSFFYDTQCGFKAFRRSTIKILANLQTVNGGMFDIEYLYIAKKMGMKIEKIRTFKTAEKEKTRIRIMHCVLNDPIDLVKIKINGLMHRYYWDFE